MLDERLRLYVFDYEGWGEYWFVMSDSPEHALAAVKKKLLADSETMWMHKNWEDATLENLPKGYTLNVYDKDHVIQAEWS